MPPGMPNVQETCCIALLQKDNIHYVKPQKITYTNTYIPKKKSTISISHCLGPHKGKALALGSCFYELEISFPQTVEASLYPEIIKGNGNIMNV